MDGWHLPSMPGLVLKRVVEEHALALLSPERHGVIVKAGARARASASASASASARASARARVNARARARVKSMHW